MDQFLTKATIPLYRSSYNDACVIKKLIRVLVHSYYK